MKHIFKITNSIIFFIFIPIKLLAGDPGHIFYYYPQYQKAEKIIEKFYDAKKNKSKIKTIANITLYKVDEANILRIGFGWNPHENFNISNEVKKVYDFITHKLDIKTDSFSNIDIENLSIASYPNKDIYLYSDTQILAYKSTCDSKTLNIMNSITKYYEEDRGINLGFSGSSTCLFYFKDLKGFQEWEIHFWDKEYSETIIKYCILPKGREILPNIPGIIYPKIRINFKNDDNLYFLVMQPKINLRKKIYEDILSILLQEKLIEKK